MLQSQFGAFSQSSCRDETRRGVFRQYLERRQAEEGAESGLQAQSKGGRNAKVEACTRGVWQQLWYQCMTSEGPDPVNQSSFVFIVPMLTHTCSVGSCLDLGISPLQYSVMFPS